LKDENAECGKQLNEFGACQHCWDKMKVSCFVDFHRNIMELGINKDLTSKLIALYLPDERCIPALLVVGHNEVSIQGLGYLDTKGYEINDRERQLMTHLKASSHVAFTCSTEIDGQQGAGISLYEYDTTKADAPALICHQYPIIGKPNSIPIN
jgi:hypothetical protein